MNNMHMHKGVVLICLDTLPRLAFGHYLLYSNVKVAMSESTEWVIVFRY